MKHTQHISCAVFAAITALLTSCGGGGDGAATTTTPTTTTNTSTNSTLATACQNATVTLDANNLPPGFATLATMSGVTVSRSGSFVRVTSTSVPNHKSPYFAVSDARYEANPNAGFAKNPSSIAAQNYVLMIPAQPTCATSTTDTSLDAIGVASNGVVFFNQYAAGNAPLTSEIVSFDQYNGHPAQQNNYHYHFEPKYLTASSSSALIGWALDGFPVYGPKNPNGSTPTLDRCNGQFSATPEFPNGIYHYHSTSVAPYMIGCYAGTPGTKSN
jgi:YHYH protein